MKRQYLGDSKDSFKWDYHHFLVESLGYSDLTIAWMMTRDDNGPDGKTSPELFPARREILTFCNRLRASREPELLKSLPTTTNARYSVNFHKPEIYFCENQRDSYFGSIKLLSTQVLFLDPDNGFEPERSFSDKHVRYAELEMLLDGAAENSVITIFQHHRRKKFPADFARIRERLRTGIATAVYWHSLMFVSVSLSANTISRIRKINSAYAESHPVEVLV